MAAAALEAVLRRDRLIVLASLLGLALIAWLYLFHLAGEMAGMDAATDMPGMRGMKDMGGMAGMDMASPAAAIGPAAEFAVTAAMWMVMMIGMMAPSAAPTVLLFSALERKRTAASALYSRTALFVLGYFLVWAGFSALAALAQAALAQAGLISSRMAVTSAFIGGSVFILAGFYEWTPLKNRCLKHCRAPFDWLPRHWRAGARGALRMGAEHGAYCLGCCWVLMLLLFVGGVMNLAWVALLAALILAQKLLPGGVWAPRLTGAVLLVCGVVIISQPLLA